MSTCDSIWTRYALLMDELSDAVEQQGHPATEEQQKEGERLLAEVTAAIAAAFPWNKMESTEYPEGYFGSEGTQK